MEAGSGIVCNFFLAAEDQGGNGTPEQLQKYLPLWARGTRYVPLKNVSKGIFAVIFTEVIRIDGKK